MPANKETIHALHVLADKAIAGHDNEHAIDILEDMQSALGMRADGLREELNEREEGDSD